VADEPAGRDARRGLGDRVVRDAEEHDVRVVAGGAATVGAGNGAHAGERRGKRGAEAAVTHDRTAESRRCHLRISVQLPANGDAGRELSARGSYPGNSANERCSDRRTIAARVYDRGVPSKDERREALKAVFHEAQGCTRCPQLAEARHTVVFGAGNADADLMFVGEAPGRHEDEQGLPFVGQAGRLLDTLLGEIGLSRDEVFVANVLKCRPPGNRDPLPVEIEHCQDYLFRQIELIEPTVICTLGNFATKLLRADPTGITRLHGQEEVRVIGPRAVRLYPLFHPAAALYTRANVEVLRTDFARIPELLDKGAPPQPEPVRRAPDPVIEDPAVAEEPGAPAVAAAQLGLF
jgi:uracil-DNA glycosylase